MNVSAQAIVQDTELQLERYFDAPVERVWQAWTAQPGMMRWIGPEGTDVYEVEADVQVGGRYSLRMRTPNGEDHCLIGEYREIVQAEKLVFTWAWHTMPERESMVTVEFAADGAGTLLRLTHQRFVDRETTAAHAAGWEGSMKTLQQSLA